MRTLLSADPVEVVYFRVPEDRPFVDVITPFRSRHFSEPHWNPDNLGEVRVEPEEGCGECLPYNACPPTAYSGERRCGSAEAWQYGDSRVEVPTFTTGADGFADCCDPRPPCPPPPPPPSYDFDSFEWEADGETPFNAAAPPPAGGTILIVLVFNWVTGGGGFSYRFSDPSYWTVVFQRLTTLDPTDTWPQVVGLQYTGPALAQPQFCTVLQADENVSVFLIGTQGYGDAIIGPMVGTGADSIPLPSGDPDAPIFVLGLPRGSTVDGATLGINVPDPPQVWFTVRGAGSALGRIDPPLPDFAWLTSIGWHGAAPQPAPPCGPGRYWNGDPPPPLLRATITAVHAGGGAWKPTDWMLQLLGLCVELDLVRWNPDTGCVVWYACVSIPAGVKNLGVRMTGGIQVTLRTCCPAGPGDWKLRWYVFPAGSNPAPEIVDPPEPGDGAGASSLLCGPPLVGAWSLHWADWSITEGPCPLPPPPPGKVGYWGGYFAGDYWADGYWDSTGSGPPPPPPPGGFWGGYYGGDFWSMGYWDGSGPPPPSPGGYYGGYFTRPYFGAYF